MFFGGDKITAEFPDEFHIDNTHFGLDSPLRFVPIPQGSDAKIYTIDPSTKKPIEFKFHDEAHVRKGKKLYSTINYQILFLRSSKLTSIQKPNQSALCTESIRINHSKW